jgi:hypothetical protein
MIDIQTNIAGSVRFSASAANAIMWGFRYKPLVAGESGQFFIKKLSIAMATAVATELGLFVQNVNVNDGTPNTQKLPYKIGPGRSDVGQSGDAVLVQSWTVQPTVVLTNPVQRIILPATVGAKVDLDFGDRGLCIGTNFPFCAQALLANLGSVASGDIIVNMVGGLAF